MIGGVLVAALLTGCEQVSAERSPELGASGGPSGGGRTDGAPRQTGAKDRAASLRAAGIQYRAVPGNADLCQHHRLRPKMERGHRRLRERGPDSCRAARPRDGSRTEAEAGRRPTGCRAGRTGQGSHSHRRSSTRTLAVSISSASHESARAAFSIRKTSTRPSWDSRPLEPAW